MKKFIASSVIVSGLLFTSLNAGDVFVGLKLGAGSGKVALTDGNTAATFTDSDSISTTDMQVYAGLGHLYLFYQTGTISPDTKYMGDFDYNAFGLGWLTSWKKYTISGFNIQPEFSVGLGYDSLTGNGNGIYDDDKTGLLLTLSLGGAFSLASFEHLKLTADIGYDLHVVNDSSSSANDGSWNFGAIRYNIGVRYGF